MTVIRIEADPEGRGSKMFVDEQQISGGSLSRIVIDASEGTTIEIQGYELSESGKLLTKVESISGKKDLRSYSIKVSTPMTISVVGDFENYLGALPRVK